MMATNPSGSVKRRRSRNDVLPRLGHPAEVQLTAAIFRLFVGFPQLVFRPFTLFTIGGVFQPCSKFVFSVFKRLASLPVPMLGGGGAPWDDDDPRDLKLNSGTLGMARR
jgi:hypothetical protein